MVYTLVINCIVIIYTDRVIYDIWYTNITDGTPAYLASDLI